MYVHTNIQFASVPISMVVAAIIAEIQSNEDCDIYFVVVVIAAFSTYKRAAAKKNYKQPQSNTRLHLHIYIRQTVTAADWRRFSLGKHFDLIFST